MKPVRGADRSEADRSSPASEPTNRLDVRDELVFAIAHEIGNHLGAIRLQAHLLDEELDARALATASIEIDGLAGRAGPLLALLRPILLNPPQSGSGSTWAIELSRLSRQLEDDGTRGVRIEVRLAPEEGALAAPAFDWLPSLLIALLGATIASLPRRGAVRIRLEPGEAGTTLVVEDDGPPEDLSLQASLRGRPLVVAIARWLVGRAGGGVEIDRREDWTRVAIRFAIQP
jgi:hypothetical protein